jgi:hypothetical protein
MKKNGRPVVACYSRIVFVLSLCSILAFLAACAGVSNVKWIPTPGSPMFEPYVGDVRVLQKEYGFPADLQGKKYYVLGRISGRSTWCGITPPIQNEKLQKHLVEQARQKGGNVIMLICGYGGTMEGDCYCYGDVLRFEE